MSITTEVNIKATDFLDVAFNLQTGLHRPFKKATSNPIYVHNDSNHPMHVEEELPQMIGRRISNQQGRLRSRGRGVEQRPENLWVQQRVPVHWEDRRQEEKCDLVQPATECCGQHQRRQEISKHDRQTLP